MNINVIPKNASYGEVESSLNENNAYKTAKNYENWIFDCVKEVTGDDLRGKSEEELRTYFESELPIVFESERAIVSDFRGNLVTLQYKNKIFTINRSQLEVV